MADNIYIENSAFIQPGGGGGNLQELYGRFPDSAQLTFYRRVAFRLRIYEKFSDDIIKVLLPTDAQNKCSKRSQFPNGATDVHQQEPVDICSHTTGLISPTYFN